MKSQRKYFRLYKDKKIIEINSEKINYEVKRRNVKYARLEFLGRKLILILPKNHKNEEEIIAKKIEWIYEKYKYLSSFIREDLKNNFFIFGEKKPIEINESFVKFDGKIMNKKEYILLLKSLLLNKLNQLIEKYSKELKVKQKRVVIRSQKTKWASLSSNKTLSFNLKTVSLPEKLMEYLVYHEMLHFFEKKHNLTFITKMKEKFKDAEEKEKELASYWVSLTENEIWKKLTST